MATLVLIRHAQASYGQADYDRLSPRGTDQARALGSHLAADGFDALFRGPHVRHAQTAELATQAALGSDRAPAGARGLPQATVLEELAEYPAFAMLQHFMPRLVAEDERFAQLASAPTRELSSAALRTVMARWMSDEWHDPEVERVAAFTQRVRAGLDRVIREAGSGARIGVVTSAGPIGVAVGLVFGASAEHMVRTSMVVRNASITELRFRSSDFTWHPERISLLTFNATHHLPTELHTEY